LPELAAELLAGRGPIVGDILTQLLNMTLEIHLIFLEPADVELLARGATLELAGKVFLVVANDPVSSAAALAYMCPNKGTRGFLFLTS
jgi:hypothetical protein